MRYYTAFLLMTCWFVGPMLHAQQVRLNEIMSSNAVALADEDGDYPDWIELYNHGNEAVNLFNYGLSDDPQQPFRWRFPAVILGPGEYLVVYASGKDRPTAGQPLHTNFSISAEGEPIILKNQLGQTVDSLGPVALQRDVSWGRLVDEPLQLRYFQPASPGAANTTPAYTLLLGQVEASHTPGYYTTAFDLQLSHTQAGAQIVYTTDGAIPRAGSPTYSAPIPVFNRTSLPNGISMIPTNNNPDPGPPYYEGWQPPAGQVFKINVIRARALHPDAPPGPERTFTYIVDPAGAQRYRLPVFSLATDFENLFDAETGIYVYGNHNNYFQDGPEWERPANLSMFEQDGQPVFSENIGIRIHGNTTRSRPRKSLRIIAKSEYGSSWITHRLFPWKNINQYKRFLLRNGGNDWDFATFRDGFLQGLMRNMKVDRQDYRPAILFINGEYWGIHNLRDRYDEHYIYTKYGIQEHEMTMMENNSEHKYGSTAGVVPYNYMRGYISQNNMAQNVYYQPVKGMMDVESFIDFQIAHIFAMNTDWPGNNTLYWRYNRGSYDPNALNGRDGLWRWMLLDMDFGFGLPFNYVPGVGMGPAHNTLAFALASNGPAWPNPPWSTMIFRRLVQNEEFKNQFIHRFCDLLNTDLSEASVERQLDSLQALLSPYMQEHVNRWRRPGSLNEWNNNIQVMRNFARQRPAYVRQHLKSQFQLQEPVKLTIRINPPEAGKVLVNTATSSDGWSGWYFPGIPLCLRAQAAPGYRFVGWAGAASGIAEHTTLSLTGHAQVEALFEPSNDFQGDSLNPVAYRLANGPYRFGYWDANQPERTYPPHMVFQQSSKNDPGLNDPMTHPYHVPPSEMHGDDAGSIGFPYRLTRRTRLNGLGDQGISLINTGRGRDLGAVVLALDTRGLHGITVGWTGGTVLPNSRVYAIRLQYRTSLDQPFVDVPGAGGEPVEYQRSATAGHTQVFAPVTLPPQADNQAYVQLRWKYYYTGQQINASDGSRDMLRLDDIEVNALNLSTSENTMPSVEARLWPNPATNATNLQLNIAENQKLSIALYDAGGRLVKRFYEKLFHSGGHQLTLAVDDVRPGMYYVRIAGDRTNRTLKLSLTR
ncbi:MAG: CotH kinase family protein [Bacteroidetes bacterium]|nr:CotH kinase family protein [Bacteroidota bacterium]